MTTAEIEARRAELRRELAEAAGPRDAEARELEELEVALRVIRRPAGPPPTSLPLIGLVGR